LKTTGEPSVWTIDVGLVTRERATSTHTITPKVIIKPYLIGIFIMGHKKAQKVQNSNPLTFFYSQAGLV
jgi:hypothetical protein